MNKSGEFRSCKCCGKSFYVAKWRMQKAKFCSHDCQNHGQYTNRTYICINCGKEFKDSASKKKRKFCSIECYSANNATEKERRRKTRAYSKAKRGSNSSRNLRKYILRIKDFKCAVCGYNDKSYCIDLHHIDGNADNNTIDNIVMLCCICHRKLHKKDISL